MHAQPPVNWRKPDTTREAIERDISHALEIGNQYVELLAVQGHPLKGARILELGPGYNYGASLVLACHGAQMIVADRFPVPWLEDYHPHFYGALAIHLGVSQPDISTFAITQCVELSNTRQAVTVVDAPAEDLSRLRDGSIDVVLSNAVLEHAQDPIAVASELFRVTRPEGIGIHQIDFRDHRDFSKPLEYLLLEHADFEKMFDERHGECGRQTRPRELGAIFHDAGFKINGFDPNWFSPEAYLDDFMPRLRRAKSMYKAACRDDLRAISGRFFLSKPAQN